MAKARTKIHAKRRQSLQEYREILTFDHPTISISLMLNALDLRRAFKRYVAISTWCHSRGGLVTRWWWEGMDPYYNNVRRAVCVGSPLSGTSLAAPAQLRSALDLLTNVAEALTLAGDVAATAFPLAGFVSGLMRVISSVTRLGARTPLLDAAVAMIPGVVGMSREGNNFEMLRLRNVNPPDRPAISRWSATSNPNRLVGSSGDTSRRQNSVQWTRGQIWSFPLPTTSSSIPHL